MTRQYFDDGTYLDFDALGNVVGGVDSGGAAVGAGSSSVVNQFMALLNLGVRAAIYDRYPNAAPVAAGQPTPAQVQKQNMIGLLLLAGGAFLLYKLAT